MKRVLILLLFVLVAGCGRPNPDAPFMCPIAKCQGGIGEDIYTEYMRVRSKVVTCPHCDAIIKPVSSDQRTRLDRSIDRHGIKDSSWGQTFTWQFWTVIAILVLIFVFVASPRKRA